jgi:probable metal-binding protein|tara:strand:+ start:620 stop:862 length:243 start_codon:yes stop_codon:yes gene_type:complete
MKESIHGHEVMSMMIESGKEYTKDSLLAAIKEKFGEDARFHTCSADNMDCEGIISFLEARGKFIETDTGFKTEKDRICNH